MTTGERIKQRRIELGLSQEELAVRCGFSHKTSISKIESGKQNLTQSKIAIIADALETTPGFIMGWDDEDRNNEFVALLEQLPVAEQDHLLEYMKFLLKK